MNIPETDRLLQSVEDALDVHTAEASETADAELWDVFVVGSAFTDDFEPHVSDLDICVVVEHPSETGVLHGFEAFLREDWQFNLQRNIDHPVSKVDVGVYTRDSNVSMIGDSRAYSCALRRFVAVED